MTTPAPTVPFDPTKFNAAAKTKQILMIRQKIKEVKERHAKELEDFVNFEARLMGEFIAFMQATKQQNCKNVNGTPYLSLKVTYSVEDINAYQRHVIGTESWGMLTWGVAKTAADEFVKEHNALPPGVKRSAMVTLGVLSPPKPKTVVSPSPKGNAGPTVDEDKDIETL